MKTLANPIPGPTARPGLAGRAQKRSLLSSRGEGEPDAKEFASFASQKLCALAALREKQLWLCLKKPHSLRNALAGLARAAFRLCPPMLSRATASAPAPAKANIHQATSAR